MTMVPPSLTMTVVLAVSVTMVGMPWTCLSKLAMSFLMSMCMITEPLAVIWGVTFISRAALMYWVVTVLFWLVWMGMRSPWVISAGMLFWVVARGEEMSRPCPFGSWRSGPRRG